MRLTDPSTPAIDRRVTRPGERSWPTHYALVGQPETLVVYERMETARLLLYRPWDGELEDVLLDDLAHAWGAHRPTR